MTPLTRSTAPLAAHAVCAAAGMRDGLRAAQFYARDLSNADGAAAAPFLSRAVARLARLTDRIMSWGANLAISLFLPGWRALPSPFTPGLMDGVARAIRDNSFLHNPTFNAYFFRAIIHVIQRYSEPPFLVLEHRVDAARRRLANMAAGGASETVFLARTLIVLSGQGPVARIGKVSVRNSFFGNVDPNVAAPAIACVALLFAGDGKPGDGVDEDEFFAVSGALIGPRLGAIAALIAVQDEQGLAREFEAIKGMY